MDQKDREMLVADIVGALAGGEYVMRPQCDATMGSVTRAIEEIHEDVKEQKGVTGKMVKIVDVHLAKHEAHDEQVVSQTSKETLRLRRLKTWVWIAAVAVGLVGSLAAGAYALGQMEERIMVKIERNGNDH